MLTKIRGDRSLGKGEVESSILSGSTSFTKQNQHLMRSRESASRQIPAEQSEKTATKAVGNPWSTFAARSDLPPVIASPIFPWDRERIARYTRLYIMTCAEFVKVGFAQDVERRLFDLQSGNPFPMAIAAHAPVSLYYAPQIERVAHELLRAFHHSREWFRVDLATAKEVTTLARAWGRQKRLIDEAAAIEQAFA